MASIPEAALEHYRYMQALQLLTLRAGRRAWARINPDRIWLTWQEQTAVLLPVLEAAQSRAALAGSTYGAMTLAQQNTYVAPEEFTDPAAFAGFASDGRNLEDLVATPAVRSLQSLREGMAPLEALLVGRAALDRVLWTQVADAARQAAGVDILARPGVGYVRMLNPPSCSRCTVLAGRFFRWNDGFRRHPRCDCRHVPTTVGDRAEAYANGLIDDPYRAFSGMDPAEQDRVFGKAGAAAIRDGADLSQVVNSRRGMTSNGLFTEEGTTRFGNAAKGLKPGQRRLTPEGIYDQANRFGKDREWAIERLREHGYILPKGQVVGGSLRGQREGYGQLGTGGGPVFGTSSPRRAAQAAIDEARRTGIRDPRNRYTMTAAERRLYDAERRYEVALSGWSPYTSPGFGNAPDPYGLGLNRAGVSRRRVTDVELAQAEREYRNYLASRGQIFDR